MALVKSNEHPMKKYTYVELIKYDIVDLNLKKIVSYNLFIGIVYALLLLLHWIGSVIFFFQYASKDC